MQDTKFDLWCMVELFGHSKIAIPATEQEYLDSKPLRKCHDCGSEWKGNDSCPECFPI
mgnify:CR=1 FL=1